MKALIMSVKAGYGHHSTGMAMVNCFREHGWESDMLDTFDYINKYLGDSVQDGYLFTSKYLKTGYGMIYGSLAGKDKPYQEYSLESIITKYLSKKLINYVKEYKPDVIIGTHSYACALMTELRVMGAVDCPLYGIVTDFTMHPFWESTKLDYYVLPDALLTPSACKKEDITAEKVLPTGIPIKKQFSYKSDKKEMREKLGLKDIPTVLVMMGSMGFGNMEEVVSDIDDSEFDCQAVIICGNNEEAKESIEQNEWKKNIICLGFTTNVDEYMDASDVIITKPGGLTTSESMAKKLPMILMNPIPGHEMRNMEFLVNSGAAIGITDTFKVRDALYQFFSSEWRRNIAVEAVSNLGKPNATEDLYNHITNNR